MPSSLLSNPREFLGRARGPGKFLDYTQTRLGLNEEELRGEPYRVINGYSRNGAVRPLVVGFNSEHLLFEPVHPLTSARNTAFEGRPKQQEAYDKMPEEFIFKDVTDAGFSPQIATDMLANGQKYGILIRHQTGLYRKVTAEAQAEAIAA